MRKKSKYSHLVIIIVVSTSLLASVLVITSLKSLDTHEHFSQLILEENKTFLISTLRFGHDLMARMGAERYQDIVDLALKSKFILYLAILDNEGKLTPKARPLPDIPLSMPMKRPS